MLRKISIFFLFLFLFLSSAQAARAGFGVSPPNINNHQLAPGTIYKQQIMLLRSEAVEELKATVKVNAPEIESWISIDRGSEFVLPKGELQVPMIVTFKIPKGADLGNYTGSINVRIVPVAGSNGGGVSITLGARIDIDLALTNISSTDFLVRKAELNDFEKLRAPWNWKIWSKLFDRLFYKIQLALKIENTGNTKTAPSKITIKVYDLTKKNLLEEHEDKTLAKIKPFSTEIINADFPTKLPVGQYWSKIQIYKGEEIVNFYEIAFSVVEPGKLGGEARSLGVWPWLTLVILFLIAASIIFVLIKIRIWRWIIWLILLPTKPVWTQIKNATRGLNKAFWQWVHKQAEKHKDEK